MTAASSQMARTLDSIKEQKLASENSLVDAYMRIMKMKKMETEAQGGTQ